jgi:hypothetical protein
VCIVGLSRATLAGRPAARYIAPMAQLGRSLLVIGAVLVLAGLLLTLAERWGLGRLPGDIVWRRKSTTVYFPIVTSVVLSLALTLILNLLFRRK